MASPIQRDLTRGSVTKQLVRCALPPVTMSLIVGAVCAGLLPGSARLLLILLKAPALAEAILFNHLWGIHGVFIACAIAPASSVPIGWFYRRRGYWKKSLTGRASKA